MYVAYSRQAQDYSKQSRYEPTGIGYRTFVKGVIDGLAHPELGYIESHLGFKSESSGFRFRMRATPKLATLFDHHRLSRYMVLRSEDGELILLKDENKQLIEYEERLRQSV